jgi:hypothetical protein
MGLIERITRMSALRNLDFINGISEVCKKSMAEKEGKKGNWFSSDFIGPCPPVRC